MQNNLIEKFLTNKEKILVSYAMSLHKAFKIDGEDLWNTEEEFKKLMSGIIKIYINKYYLMDYEELNKLNTNNLKEEDLKLTISLAIIVDYYQKGYEEIKEKYKESIYSLTLILYVITNADKKISFYNKYDITNKNIMTLLNKLFGEVIGADKLEKDPFIMNSLASKIKDAELQEIRFFESLKDSESFITFKKYSEDNYYVKYNYELNSLMKYNNKHINNTFKLYKYKEKYMSVIYDLTAIMILKCYSNNCKVPTFIVPISAEYLCIKSNETKLRKIFSNPNIQSKVKFSSKYNDYKLNYNYYKKLKDLGFTYVQFLNDSDLTLDYKQIKKDTEFYVTQGFFDLHAKFEEHTEKNNVRYSIVENDEINEDKLIDLFLEEEN